MRLTSLWAATIPLLCPQVWLKSQWIVCNVAHNELISLFPVPSQPTDFKGEAKSETSILLSWNAPAQTGLENQVTGYELTYRKKDDKDEVITYNGNSLHFKSTCT